MEFSWNLVLNKLILSLPYTFLLNLNNLFLNYAGDPRLNHLPSMGQGEA